MKKFAFIGAGSMVFTRNLVMDLLHFEHFRDAELCLMDIDEKRLAYAEKCVEKVVRAMQVPAHITTTTDRSRALEGADGVVCTVFNGDTDISKLEVDIPYQFGVSMNIGDTRSVGGIFRCGTFRLCWISAGILRASARTPCFSTIRTRWVCSAKRCRRIPA